MRACCSQGEVGASWLSRRLVVARDLVGPLAEKLGVGLTQLGDAFKGAVLEGVTYTHPLYTRTSPVVIGGDYITTETGECNARPRESRETLNPNPIILLCD